MNIDKTMEEVNTSIREFVLENYLFGYDEDDLDNDSSFLELGVLDSTGIMELVAFLEKEFDIEVSDSEIIPENLDSINCISNYVCSKLDSAAKE
jgi:acyl carrier protein